MYNIAVKLLQGQHAGTIIEAKMDSSQVGRLRELDERGVLEIVEIYEISAVREAGANYSGYSGIHVSLVREEVVNKRPQIMSSTDVVELLRKDIGEERREVFGVLYLDTKNYLLHSQIIAIGSLNQCIVHPREVFREAVRRAANSIILVHNHPSGDVTPSLDDENITKQLKEAGKILGIELLDHVIVGNGCFVSMKEKGAC